MSAPPNPPTGSDPRKDSLIEYPCRFPIKVMGAMADGFADALAEVPAGSTLVSTRPPWSCARARAAITWA